MPLNERLIGPLCKRTLAEHASFLEHRKSVTVLSLESGNLKEDEILHKARNLSEKVDSNKVEAVFTKLVTTGKKLGSR